MVQQLDQNPSKPLIRFLESRLVFRAVAVLILLQVVIGCVKHSECVAGLPTASAVIGEIDGITYDGSQFYLSGWACQQGSPKSIHIHIYADHSAYDEPKGTFVCSAIADLPNEQAVAQRCQDNGQGKHRFRVALSGNILSKFQGRKLFVHGIRTEAGVMNSALNGSGSIEFPYIPLPGAYSGTPGHPRVFMNRTDLQNSVERINMPGTYSAQRFERLTQMVKADLNSKAQWGATYSGNDIDIYLHAYSIESAGGYANEQRSDDQLRSALNLPPGEAVPRGAAIVAARLALYAALVKDGAVIPSSAPSPQEAAHLAQRILLAWSRHGFREQNGSLRQSIMSYQDAQGRHVVAALQIARGIVYSVEAQDLLEAVGTLTMDESREITSFHAQMFDAIRLMSNEEALRSLASRNPDETYNNQFACHLTAMLAISQLLNDKERMYAALYCATPHMQVRMPWTLLFNHVMYGINDKPQLRVTPNSTDDSATSSPSFSTKIVAPGEINDRYRHWGKAQAFGYTSGTLTAFYRMAEILRLAGFDAYSYQGTHRQSIRMSTDYYALYAKSVGFNNEVTADNARLIPDFQEYIGQIVNGVDNNVIMGAYRFPEDRTLVDLNADAKAAMRASRPDPIDFGKWAD